MNYDNFPIDNDLDLSKLLSGYTTNQAQDRILKLSNLCKQYFGDRWQFILLLIFLFVFVLCILIRYGLILYSENINLFLSIFIFSIFFFILWTLILPEKDNNKIGIVSFPKKFPYIPSDSTMCGSTVVTCENNSDCDTLCTLKDKNSSNYVCTNIGDKNVFYLGSELQKNKAYCLPKQDITTLDKCGTYSGRAIWSQNENGQKWICKCLYPDLYNGSDCTSKVDTNSKLCLDDTTCWDPTNMSPSSSLINKSPYELKTICNEGYNFYGGECQKDLCLNGNSYSVAAKFDNNDKKCKCTSPLYQSNISGYCFADATDTCNPHPTTNLCQYTIDIGGSEHLALFKIGGIPYLSYNYIDENLKKTSILVNVTDFFSSDYLVDLVEMNDTSIGSDAFYSFPIKNFSELTQEQKTEITDKVKVNVIKDKDKLSELFSGVSTGSSGNTFSVAKLCNSFYYKRDGKDNCDNMLSITGTDQKTFCTTDLTKDCGSSDATKSCTFDLYKGKSCNCNTGDFRKNKQNFCEKCFPDQFLIDKKEEEMCCSGESLQDLVCEDVGGNSSPIEKCTRKGPNRCTKPKE